MSRQPGGAWRAEKCACCAALLLLALAPAHSGCSDTGLRARDTPLFGPRQRGPSWCITGEVAYEDLGVVCVRPDGITFADRRLAGLRVVYPGPGVNDPLLPRGSDPDWSPDGRWFVCEIDDQIYRVAREGGISRLTDAGRNARPRISPDGHWIVYEYETGVGGPARHALRRTAVDGLERNDLGDPDSPDRRQADWFPDGRGLVCAQARPEDGVTPNLYLVTPTGDAATRLTNSPRAQHHPHVSPDGTRIAYIEQPARGPGELWVMDMDGGGARRVGAEPATELDWSPDGREIVYLCLDEGGAAPGGDASINGTLRIITLATGRVRSLTTNWPEICPVPATPTQPSD